MKIASVSFATLALCASQSSQAVGLISLVDLGLGSQSLNRFDSATPGASNLVPVTGLESGETLLGIDFRPATGLLIGLGSANNLYTVNTVTGVSTIIGSGLGAGNLTASAYGFDFNPTIDRIRIVGTDDSNTVGNPNDGTTQLNATAVFYNAGDLNTGANPNLVHHAYTNNFVGATTSQLYGIDSALDILVTQVNNDGILNTRGALGFDISESGGFDIDGADGTAYAALTVGGTSGLYTINLANGQATLLGALSGNVSGLAVVPEPSSALLGAIGALALLRRKRSN